MGKGEVEEHLEWEQIFRTLKTPSDPQEVRVAVVTPTGKWGKGRVTEKCQVP